VPSTRRPPLGAVGREYVRAKLSTGLTWLPGKKNLLPRLGLEKLSPDGKRQTLKLRRDSTEGGDKKDGGGLQLIAPPQEKVVATVEGISEYLAKKRRRDRWKIVIDPRKSQFMSLWDVVMMLSLLYLSLVTPFEVAFLPAKDYYDELFFVNRGVDCIFLVDMVLNFFVMFTLVRRAGPTARPHRRGPIACVPPAATHTTSVRVALHRRRTSTACVGSTRHA
jgi:hypothetical protein